MSLNDRINSSAAGPAFTMEDLGLGNVDAVNKDGVLGLQSEQAPAATIDVDTTSQQASQTTNLNESEIDELPSWDSKIRIIKDKANVLVDMREVQKDIEGTGALNVTHTDAIEATFESFYSPTNIRQQYASFNALTGYSHALSFMQAKQKATLEALVTEFESLKNEGMQQMAQDMLDAREFCAGELIDDVALASGQIQAVIDQLMAGPVLLPFSGDRFVNLRDENLLDIEINEVDKSIPLPQSFIDAVCTLKKLWVESEGVQRVARSVFDKYRAINDSATIPEVHDGLFVASLAILFNDETVEQCYSHFVQEPDQKVQLLKTRVSEIDASVQEGTDIAEAVSVNASSLIEASAELASHKKAAQEFADFTKAAAVFVTTLTSLQ